MTDDKKINPLDYADDHRVAYLVQEWQRLTQAEKDAQELIEVDPAMKESLPRKNCARRKSARMHSLCKWKK